MVDGCQDSNCGAADVAGPAALAPIQLKSERQLVAGSTHSFAVAYDCNQPEADHPADRITFHIETKNGRN